MPVLGGGWARSLDAGEIAYDAAAGVLRYFDHEFPVEPGTEPEDGEAVDRARLEELLADQHYRLASWRVANDELNYRRFFDVTSLIAVRVEDPVVFAATHELIAKLVADGTIDGLRIDHPDGLADPGGYLRDLAELTGGRMGRRREDPRAGRVPAARGTARAPPATTRCTRWVGSSSTRPAKAPLTSVYSAFTGEPSELAEVVRAGKREVVDAILLAEIDRLVRALRRLGRLDARWADHPDRHWRQALQALLVEFDVYRAYVTPGEPAPPESGTGSTRRCNARLPPSPTVTAEIGLLGELASGLR